MENKKNLICLACGTVQTRTDIEKIMGDDYKLSKGEYICPCCNKITSHVVTNNIHVLRKNLGSKKEQERNKMDERILCLIRR